MSKKTYERDPLTLHTYPQVSFDMFWRAQASYKSHWVAFIRLFLCIRRSLFMYSHVSFDIFLRAKALYRRHCGTFIRLFSCIHRSLFVLTSWGLIKESVGIYMSFHIIWNACSTIRKDWVSFDIIGLYWHTGSLLTHIHLFSHYLEYMQYDQEWGCLFYKFLFLHICLLWHTHRYPRGRFALFRHNGSLLT